MKNVVICTTIATLAAVTTPALSADLDYERQVGLIVSGVVDKWAGVQIIDDLSRPTAQTGTVFINGGEGRLSLPLGANLSIQSDVKYEYNEYALEAPNLVALTPRYSFGGATHLSWRDPSYGLFGIFGGAGSADFTGVDTYYRFLGGEAQFYANDLTFYAQAGWVDFSSPEMEFDVGVPAADDGIFARGVVRWFLSPTSRLQLEGSYLSTEYSMVNSSLDTFSVEAGYDFTLAGMPVIGDTPIFLAYRGTFRDLCSVGEDVDDHTFMIGTSYSFSGDMLTVDRQGATLDTPDILANGCGGGGAAAQASDMRLKTDIVALGTDANGNKVYSWKYKSDPVTTWVGVMAQDLVDTHPEALVVDANGYYAVRYDLIGARMMTLEQWNSRTL